MTAFAEPPRWERPSSDPNDETFGDVVAAATLETAAAYDAVLVGEPYDGAVIGRRGAREGPAAIREALAGTKTHHFDAGPVAAVGDLGDVALLASDADGESSASVADLQRRLRETTAAVHDADALPVFLGGDNSLTYANVAPLLERGTVGVVNLDAHLDVREVREDATSGTPYRQLLDDGLAAYACVGARHFETSEAYHGFVRDRGGEVVTAEEVGADPVEAARLALDAMDDAESVYVSLDCDVLDASAAPGVSAPTPGGVSTRELYRLLRVLAGDDRLAGFEVVECAPPLDRDGLTVDAAARAVAHVLAGATGVSR
ncbi:formimidoylglutamase [Salinilacihabitans rarus]|uniref:formimidoylglutamase n=1 Tax=Salinilacihabitans rarus TaxID=2961596 RepID=UPI0020C8D326|nr:formimidoylglutamase [Salinilacihabitans rarus]